MRRSATLLALLFACSPAKDPVAPTAPGSTVSSASVHSEPAARPGQREFVEVSLDAPSLTCPTDCRRRVEGALNPHRSWLNRLRVDVEGKRLTMHVDVERADLAKLQAVLRQVGYPTEIRSKEKLPAKLQGQSFSPPAGQHHVLEVGRLMKTASCGGNDGMVRPEAIAEKLRDLADVVWVEFDLQRDQFTVIVAGEGRSKMADLLASVRSTGATARPQEVPGETDPMSPDGE